MDGASVFSGAGGWASTVFYLTHQIYSRPNRRHTSLTSREGARASLLQRDRAVNHASCPPFRPGRFVPPLAELPCEERGGPRYLNTACARRRTLKARRVARLLVYRYYASWRLPPNSHGRPANGIARTPIARNAHVAHLNSRSCDPPRTGQGGYMAGFELFRNLNRYIAM